MRKLLLTISLFVSLSGYAEDCLGDIMQVLKHVESNNDPYAIGDNGTSYGILQIQKACVDDVNKYYGTDYRHEDMFQVPCAEEVFKLYAQMGINRYIKRYGTVPTEESIVRFHNGGIYRGYRIQATKEYYRRYLKQKSIINLKS